ncbi:unnamed protein product [Phytomonas sp. EM1]|nr:unnamed protein product [Phytomonas sp. EM1]|eukprot:CCW61317.1 unnamed protein product [Phytomonas sp. isolate EM1]
MGKFDTLLHIGSITGEAATENHSVCPSLSFKTRIIGFIICLLTSIVLSIFGVVAIFVGDFVLFGIFYTLSNVCSIGGTLFLAGPMYQLKNMFNEYRWIASIVYLLSMLLTLIAALSTKSGFLVLFLCIIQYLAMWWYFLSYIPYARDAVRSGVTTVLA